MDALAERDWVAESQRALHPVRAGRFVVHGSHDRERLLPSRWRIEIDAGRAFGTAHHPSTKGSLMALERLAIARPLGDVMDVGTGSGILAIAANRLGARRVLAGDMDPVAVAVARDNVRRNRLTAPIRPVVASGPFAVAETVVANILARPLAAMAPQLAASAGRWLILSGLRTRDVRRVFAAYRARGFALAFRIVVDDWPTLVLERLDDGRRHRAERARIVAVSRPFRVDWD
jgi:ribosomal protein L11 methyltransferase